MSVPAETFPDPSPTDTDLREGLAWVTDDPATAQNANKNAFEWLWEALQGDFNDERSTGQIAFDAAVSMIPLVDQICDIRDLIADCKSIRQASEDEDNVWKYVALALTLIGLFPSLGSLVKGVLKIFFVFIRRYGLDHVVKGTDAAMTWVITFLRKRDVQKYLAAQHVDEVFGWLANQVRALCGKVNLGALLRAFDTGIGVMKGLLGKVTWLPGTIGERAQATIKLVEDVRRDANAGLGKALEPIQRILDAIARRLELERLASRSGIVDLHNIHFRGGLPEARAVTLMRKTDPPPEWLTRPVRMSHPPIKAANISSKFQGDMLLARKSGWPDHGKLDRFANIRTDEIKGPARLYRILSPSNMASGDCWISEEVFKKLQAAPDPKAAWRKYLAVWPEWNVNGQFVTYDVKAGETLKVWRGTTSTQVKDATVKLDASLDGGWEQVIFDPGTKVTKYDVADTMRYYKRGGGSGTRLQRPISRPEYERLSSVEKENYIAVRERINNPNISGPFETGWGYSGFSEQALDGKTGLPALPGQITQLAQ